MKYTDPWCATFVSVIAYLCGVLDIMPAECSCDYMIAKYKQLGRWVEDDAYVPNIGDTVFYDWDDTGFGDNVGSSDHVGIVAKVEGTYITIIEGNISDSVGRRWIIANQKFIRGYGIPDYAKKAGESMDDYTVITGGGEEVDPEIIIIDHPVYNVHIPLVKYGDQGEVVRAAQILLIGRKFACGGDGADGDFGPATFAAVKNFQTENGLVVDGEIGGNTWAKLLGLLTP